MRLVAKTAGLQRQLVDYQTTVSSLTGRLDDVTAQLNDTQQKLRDSGLQSMVSTVLLTLRCV